MKFILLIKVKLPTIVGTFLTFISRVLSDFINLTQVHNFTVSAHDIFYLPSTFGIYRMFYENFASTNADNETFCTILLTSQVVLVQSLQPKGPEFEST